MRVPKSKCGRRYSQYISNLASLGSFDCVERENSLLANRLQFHH